MNIRKIANEWLDRLEEEDKLDRQDISKDTQTKWNIKHTKQTELSNVLKEEKTDRSKQERSINKLEPGTTILSIEYMKKKFSIKITQIIPIDKPMGRKIIGIIEDGEEKGKEITIIRDIKEKKWHIL